MLLLAPLLGWHADGWAGIGWGVVAAVFTAVLPTLILRFGERRQYWGDRHVRRRQDRIVAAPGVMASVITGTALLYRFDAPVDVTALVTAMVAVLLALLMITFFWKVSVHSAVASGALTVLVTVFGPWSLVLAPAVLLIGWSRVRLRCHTVGQVGVGFLVGAAVSSPVFDLVR
jgi:membrane-associated phospholipid phosphatase